MSDPKVIYLAPKCEDGIDGRNWCEDDIWTDCEENGCSEKSVRYVLESDAQSELAALREEVERRAAQWQSLSHEFDNIDKRLADAERRNSEMMSMINEAFERLVCITPRNKPSGALKQQAMDILQGAAIKPIESGASK